MRRKYGTLSLAVLAAGLAGWAALALAQSNPTLPPVDAQPTLPVPYQVPDSGPIIPVGGQVTAPGTTTPVLPATTPGTPTLELPQPGLGRPGPTAVQSPVRPAIGLAEDRPAEGGPGMSPENPTGRQEPAVSLEWIGPPTAKVGQAADYAIAVRNACTIPVQQVMVRVRLPGGMTVVASEPKAISEGNVLMWELGTLQPKQERNLQMRLVPDAKGDVGCQAWVTFTGASTMKVRVREPKLVVKAAAPDRVLIGDPATFTLTVTNPGDGPADQVKVRTILSDGLEHARGKQIEYDLGNLAPGETRGIQLACATKLGGLQKCEALAEADGGLKSQDQASINVLVPRLDLEATGPKLRYLDRPAVYSIRVVNPGDAPATNVVVSDVIPAGFKFVGASDGGRHDFSTRTVAWYLGEIAPGAARDVKLELLAVNPGEHRHRVAAQAARGLKVEGEVVTRVEGLSAILLEVVDVEDPVEVGADTSYEIRVTNTGSKTETDIKLACVIPDKMDFKGAQGASPFHLEGKVVVFDPLPKLAPRADAIYRIQVKANAPGDVRFKSQITSTNLIEPVIEMEATRIYAD
jgi:uncharacterized repeat protein (TIGR01451 family)